VKFIGVIPSRIGATRLPEKPLRMILNKPLLQWVIEGTLKSRHLQEVYVATDDERIAHLAEKCGVTAIQTPSSCPTGSDRVWAAAKNLDADVILNIQGDEPLITGSVVDQLVEPFMKDPSLQMATLARELDFESLHSPHSAKVVLDKEDNAIYFSRAPIPYTRVPFQESSKAALKHLGVYAYKKNFLEKFCQQSVTQLETHESLEQLRALYMGCKIKVVRTEHDSWGVDVPEDIPKIEKLILERQRREKQSS